MKVKVIIILLLFYLILLIFNQCYLRVEKSISRVKSYRKKYIRPEEKMRPERRGLMTYLHKLLIGVAYY